MHPVQEDPRTRHFWVMTIKIDCGPAGNAARPTRHMETTKPPDQSREGVEDDDDVRPDCIGH